MTLDDLQRFCATEDRPNLSRPWNQHGETHATNGSIIVSIPEIPCHYDQPNHPDPNKVYSGFSCPVNYRPFPTQPPEFAMEPCADCRQTGKKMVVCKDCDGSGLCTCSNCNDEHDCPTCNGNGDVRSLAPCETCNGTKEVKGLSPYPVGGIHIQSRYAAMLQALPECEYGISQSNDYGGAFGVAFRFSGGRGIVIEVRVPKKENV